jgi:hypothetical protein
MQRPILIEDPDEHGRRLREQEDEQRAEREERWEHEDRAGLGRWRMNAHRLARIERARRRLGDQRDEAA